MKTNDTKPAPNALYMDNGGRIECLEHAPYDGSDSWWQNDWKPITKREALGFEREIGRPPACETCTAIARNAQR